MMVVAARCRSTSSSAARAHRKTTRPCCCASCAPCGGAWWWWWWRPNARPHDRHFASSSSRLFVAPRTHARSSSTTHAMPFSLRSDEELIAEARRALEALGVEVVIEPRASSSVDVFVKRHLLWRGGKAVILPSRAAIETVVKSGAELCPALVITIFPGTAAVTGHMLVRNHQHLDTASTAAAWWRRTCAHPERGTIVCCVCCQRVPKTAGAPPPCKQCCADVCGACAKRLAGHVANEPTVFRCPECSAWYLSMTPMWGVPWDMPRPAPTRRQATSTAAAAPSSSALPQHMAAAVGPDGWLRPPPRHQRMHPVDVLVDGVLAALDGHVSVTPGVKGRGCHERDLVAFTRLPMSDRFDGEGAALDRVRRRLRQAVDRLMREAEDAVPFQQVTLEVHRSAARVQPTVDKLTQEASMFAVRKRERAAGRAASAQHEWELAQVAPDAWWLSDRQLTNVQCAKVAYLAPERVEMPPAVRQVLRDAHARLGGTACGAKQVGFMRLVGGGKQAGVTVNRAGQVTHASGVLARGAEVAQMATSVLRHARLVGEPQYVYCRDVEAFQRAGVDPRGLEAVVTEAQLWLQEDLVWRQRQQRRQEGAEGAVRWERRGGAGRRGQRKRLPSVMFELSAWGEERRALSHEETLEVRLQMLLGSR